MKSFVKLIVLAIATLPFFVSCSGGSSSTPLFGSLAGKYAEYSAKKEALAKKAETITSEEEKAKLIKESEALNTEWKTKIEKAAQSLDGKTVDVEPGDFTITEPISLTYEGFFSESNLTPKFKVNGKLEVAKESEVKNQYARTVGVVIAGYDAEGKKVYAEKIGNADVSDKGGVKVIAAGTPVELDGLSFSRDVEYKNATTLKLEIK